MQENVGLLGQENIGVDREFYGDALESLELALTQLLDRLEALRRRRAGEGLRDPVEHCKARVKTAASMKDKLTRRGLPITVESALTQLYDAAGIRVICTFIDDVYRVAEWFRGQTDWRVVQEKDYIRSPKPNGYRSYHMLVELPIPLPGISRNLIAEIQIRTLAMDCWASLEHRLKYKHEIPNQQMLVEELKRCADEMASTDVNLQAIRDMIEPGVAPVLSH